MIKQKSYLRALKKISASLRKDQNPELYRQINRIINDPSDYGDFDLAYDLDTADLTKALPANVASFIKTHYLRAAEKDKEKRGIAYNNLGSLYYNGRTGRKDHSKAIRYYTLAEENGYRLAAENLAFCYYYGSGTTIDYEKAYYYFSKAALSDRYEAMYMLGDMFRYGYYVDKDPDMVRRSYIKAEQLIRYNYDAIGTRKGSVYRRLGDMYYEGIGVDIDYNKAYECYQRAEIGYYNQVRYGDQYNKTPQHQVQERLAELRDKIRGDLPKLEWAENRP